MLILFNEVEIMAKMSCYKIKGGVSKKIHNAVCKRKESIEKYLDKGYTITKVTEQDHKTKIESFSPKKKQQAWEEHKKRLGPAIPF